MPSRTTIGFVNSRLQSRSQPVGPTIDVDARKALQVRWAYQAGRLEQAIMADDVQAQDRIMQVLLAIEVEAMHNGVLDDLDTGDVDGAMGRPVMTPMTAKAAVGHHAQVTGSYYRLNPMIWIPKQQLAGSSPSDFKNEGADEILIPSNIKPKRQKVKVDLNMALGKRQVTADEAAAATTSGAVVTVTVPVKQVGKSAGQPLSVPPQVMVSKAEQLKAMKKAGADKAKGAASGLPKPVQLKPQKVKTPTLCLDGCGSMVGGRFAIGHDAKLKSLLTKIEKGERDIAELPEIVKPFVKFSKPIPVVADDGKTKILTYQLLMAPVRMYGRDDVEYVQDLGEEFHHK